MNLLDVFLIYLVFPLESCTWIFYIYRWNFDLTIPKQVAIYYNIIIGDFQWKAGILFYLLTI